MENEERLSKEIFLVTICPTEEFLRKEYDGYDEDAYSSDDIDIMFSQNCEIIEVHDGETFEIPKDFYGNPDDEHDYYNSMDFDSMPIGTLYKGTYKFEMMYDSIFDCDKRIITPTEGGYMTFL